MKKFLLVSFTLLAAGPAFAHEIPGPHTHPHGDWSGALALLAAVGILSALFLLPRRSARRSEDKNHDPR